jgi:hypothetical protein
MNILWTVKSASVADSAPPPALAGYGNSWKILPWNKKQLRQQYLEDL